MSQVIQYALCQVEPKRFRCIWIKITIYSDTKGAFFLSFFGDISVRQKLHFRYAFNFHSGFERIQRILRIQSCYAAREPFLFFLYPFHTFLQNKDKKNKTCQANDPVFSKHPEVENKGFGFFLKKHVTNIFQTTQNYSQHGKTPTRSTLLAASDHLHSKWQPWEVFKDVHRSLSP